ncbi:toll/interleukin-1 receptor domain-containing protein [Anaerobium acetethylicum]|uniref:TIR domain-containing protein n=1 Tax=Anaerobium acetethylicum TaxID=1619234 RepID=A0A1D3TUY3_9FIRM|nr:toll/interleukin-1 receptor domain-containing protein [Anaerobium acetethylicum]SCP97909.1 TIR domain-containing protein [Anaerobium acetethylicum]
MNYKVFISHKKEDEEAALEIKSTLVESGVEAYLDVLDNTICGDGEKLTNHIKEKIRECTDIIVVLSEKTKFSWWVPFEIGMASQKDMPIANYLLNTQALPDYLEYWPRLKNKMDVKKYVETRKSIASKIVNERAFGTPIQFSNTISETQRFYSELKKKL